MSHSSVYMPVGAKILKVGEQDSQVFVWAIVDGSSYRNEHYNLRVFGTGHLMDINGEQFTFIDTLQMSNGLVWHIFMENK